MVYENSLFGTVDHQIDDKGRIRIPSRFFPRQEGEGERSYEMKLFLIPRSEHCISVYGEEALEKMIAKLLAAENKSLYTVESKRKILSSIEPVETDKQGRVVIPQRLREHANIKRDLSTVGMVDHFEIWAKEELAKNIGSLTYAQAYSEVGLF